MKAVVLLSGGMDCTVAATMIKKEGYDLYCLHFNYNQTPSKREQKCARSIAEWLNAEDYKEINLTWFKEIGTSGLIDPTIKLTSENKTYEYVPFRNAIFLSMATAWAEVIGANILVIGSNAADLICPDNKASFITAFEKLIKEGTNCKNLKIRAPLLENNFGKAELVKKGLELRIPFKETWACHNSIDKACGVCNNCIIRINAFNKNNAKDPLEYEIGDNNE